MEVLAVNGGHPLVGTVWMQGAKNSVLPIMAGALLTEQRCVITDCPDITDLSAAAAILHRIGAKTEMIGRSLVISSENLSPKPIGPGLSGRLRGSLLFMGALLARFRQGSLSLPGGCNLGGRPIDYHIDSLKKLGVTFWEDGCYLRFAWEHPHGGEVRLPFPSVGATENIILAACGTEEPVTVYGAAREPEIEDLCRFLESMGAKTDGAGTDTVTVQGAGAYIGAVHHLMPDRMEAATCLAAAAACGGCVTIKNVCPVHLAPVLAVLTQAGCRMETSENSIIIERTNPLKAVGRIDTDVYPGFPTDAQAPIMAAMLTAEGESCFRENVFPCRFEHVPQFRLFGGKIRTKPREALVVGVPGLHGARAEATDLRGGAGVLIAALAAHGKSRISGAEHLYRGYSYPVEKLSALGAEIYKTSH